MPQAAEKSTFAYQFPSIRNGMDLGPDISSSAPSARIRRLASSPAPETTARALNTGAPANPLYQVRESNKPVTSGALCYASLCDLILSPYFQPSSDTMLRWSRIFDPGKTIARYIEHLQKAGQLRNFAINWVAPAVRGATKGVENAHHRSSKLDNFIAISLRTAPINRESINSEMGAMFRRLSFSSFYFGWFPLYSGICD